MCGYDAWTDGETRLFLDFLTTLIIFLIKIYVPSMFQGVRSCNSLRCLRLRHCPLRGNDLYHLCREMCHLSNLHHLTLANCDLQPDDVHHLANLIKVIWVLFFTRMLKLWCKHQTYFDEICFYEVSKYSHPDKNVSTFTFWVVFQALLILRESGEYILIAPAYGFSILCISIVSLIFIIID